tara:strand:+ start:158 stop:481 length:324 start_codon:yes stop_codon:yes gene_type:complete
MPYEAGLANFEFTQNRSCVICAFESVPIDAAQRHVCSTEPNLVESNYSTLLSEFTDGAEPSQGRVNANCCAVEQHNGRADSNISHMGATTVYVKVEIGHWQQLSLSG